MQHANPKFGPVGTSKHNIKDGFHWLFLQPEDSPRLSILLSAHRGEPQLIGIPVACTMGWVQSPLTFCAVSETVCGLANDAMRLQGRWAQPHQLNTIPEALDDCDCSMTPQAREAENAEANLALSLMLCLSSDIIVTSASSNSGPHLCLSEEAMHGTENNKQQQAEEVARHQTRQ